MIAQRLCITRKTRTFPVVPVSPGDFEYREDQEVDPRIVVNDPSISLYCLDHAHRRALFVVTPPDVDLSNAPFYYQAQYEAAQELIAVPYAMLHALAAAQVDPCGITLIYSTGRCGSTLVSRALNQAPGVVSFSEPDVFTQIQALRMSGACDDAEIHDLARSSMLLICGSRPDARVWAVKFRSWGIELGDVLFNVFPEARVIFLYREAEAWARSFARMARMFEPEGAKTGAVMQPAVAPLMPLTADYMATHDTPMPPLDVLACNWVGVMMRCLDLQRHGVRMFAARYEELKAAPHSVLAAMFAFCGITLDDPAMLDRVLAQDSQAGTTLSQTTTRASKSTMSDDRLHELRRLIRHYGPSIAPDIIVPQTFRP